MHTVSQSLDFIQHKISRFPPTLLILGSGWNSIYEDVDVEVELSYQDVFGVQSGVPGHEGKLVIGSLGDKRVALMMGRFHTYEGYTSEEVTRPIQVFAQLGVEEVVVTAAAGALNEKYRVGDFMMLSDMITTFCPSPLTGAQFIDLSAPFDETLSTKVRAAAHEAAVRLHEGVYCYVRGPHFETPADKMLLRHLGADAVGMSTVPEVIMARALQLRVLGIACITNLAFVQHDHRDVLSAAKAGSEQMKKMLRAISH